LSYWLISLIETFKACLALIAEGLITALLFRGVTCTGFSRITFDRVNGDRNALTDGRIAIRTVIAGVAFTSIAVDPVFTGAKATWVGEAVIDVGLAVVTSEACSAALPLR